MSKGIIISLPRFHVGEHVAAENPNPGPGTTEFAFGVITNVRWSQEDQEVQYQLDGGGRWISEAGIS